MESYPGLTKDLNGASYDSKRLVSMLQVNVPMPKSLRENGSVPNSYRATVKTAIGNRSVEKGRKLAVSMQFFGKWELENGRKLRRRDHLNYAAVLIDVLCDCLHIDDSQVWIWRNLIKIQSDTERVFVQIDYC